MKYGLIRVADEHMKKGVWGNVPALGIRCNLCGDFATQLV